MPLAADRRIISPHFGEAPFFRLSHLQCPGGDIVEDHLLVNPHLGEENAKGIKVANWLLGQGMDILISPQDQSGKWPGFVLGNSGAKILLTKESDAQKALAWVIASQKVPKKGGITIRSPAS
jgi:predicted Fe-Mo cluster-binding NifX family protein